MTSCEDRWAQVVELLRETFEAHRALGSRHDPEWAIHYADRLHAELPAILGCPLPRQELVALFLDLDAEHRARASERPREEYWADQLVERYSASADERLALYYFPSCPYCKLVLRVIDELKLEERGVEIELRDIIVEPKWREELLDHRGRATVPVLRCESEGRVRYMPESRDIVRYLRARFGDD